MKNYIVGIGASAGGLDPLKSFVRSVDSKKFPIAFIVAQHLSPDRKSVLTELISRETNLTVKEASDNESIKNHTIYITPSGYHIEVHNFRIRLRPKPSIEGPIPSINHLFASLAEFYKENAIGIILSGTGTDGADGLGAIRERSGLTIVQEPSTASYDGMPNEAIRRESTNYIAPVDEIWNIITETLQYGKIDDEDEHSDDDAKILDRVTDLKKVNFEKYKTATLHRRIEKRMTQLGVEDKSYYLDVLSDEKEVNKLFETLLIGFTHFFRDKNCFDILTARIKEFLEAKESKTIRVWVPGCATGEEAYSIAIIFHLLLGERLSEYSIQIFATDIDEASLGKARRGVYEPYSLENLDEEILHSCFTKKENKYAIKKEFRSLILFSRHDITVDPYFLNLDMVSCRNLMIYLRKDVQNRMISLFHNSLNENGLLFLGESENIRGFNTLFKRDTKEAKLYTKKFNPNQKKFLLNQYRSSTPLPSKGKRKEYSIEDALSYTLLKYSDKSLIVVNETGEIVHIQGDTKLIFEVPEGKPKTDIFSLARNRLNIEFRRLLDKAKKEKKKISYTSQQVELAEKRYDVSFEVFPLDRKYLGEELYVISIECAESEVLEMSKWENKSTIPLHLDSAEKRIKELESELTLTKEYLQNYVEELETANEELQSMNEELQSTNEELQSSNEELETSNEELQSTSEEMHTAYKELRQVNEELELKEKDLRDTKENMSSLLDNTLQSFFLFDVQGNLVELNGEASKQLKRWQKPEPEQNAHYSSCLPDSVLPLMVDSFKKSLMGNDIDDSFSINENGDIEHYQYRFSPVLASDGRVNAISLGVLDFTEYYQLRDQIESKQKLIDSIFKNVNLGIILIDEEGIVKRANKKVTEIFGYKQLELVGQPITQIIPTQNREKSLSVYKSYVEGGAKFPKIWKMATKEGQIIDADTNTSIIESNGEKRLTILTVQDITEKLKYKTILEEAGHAAKLGGWEYDVLNNYLDWTEETYDIYGMNKDEPIDIEKAKKCYTESGREELESYIERAINTGAAYDLVLPFVSFKGEQKWVRTTCKPIVDNGYTIKLLGTIQDVTDSKIAEQDLKKLSLVATRAINSVVITDGKGRIEWVNRAFTKLTGYSHDEVIGQKPGDLLQGKDTDPLTAYEISEALKNGKYYNGTILNYTKDGVKYWNELAISPIENENGSVEKFISVQKDVTGEVELRESLENSLSEKNALLKEVHHRVKNNLALVNAMLYLQGVDSGDDELEEKLRHTQNRIKSIASVHEIIYKTESFSNIRVDEYLHKIIFQLEKGFLDKTKDLKIISDIAPNMMEVEQAVPFALICNEIITNSLKHSFPNGKTGQIKVSTKQLDNKMYLEVSDNGIGLPHDFDPMNTGSLGFTLINQFVNQLKGEFEFKNDEESGAVFTLNFELAKGVGGFIKN